MTIDGYYSGFFECCFSDGSFLHSSFPSSLVCMTMVWIGGVRCTFGNTFFFVNVNTVGDFRRDVNVVYL